MGEPGSLENEQPVVDKKSRDSVYDDSQKERKRFSSTFSHQEHKELEDHADLDEIQRYREFIEKKYGVKLQILTQEETIERQRSKYIMYPELNLKELVERLSYLKEQLIKLPPSFFLKLKINQIVLACKYIKIDKDSGEKKYLSGMALFPSFSSGSTVYTVSGGPFNHEIFHILDSLMGGREGMDGSQTWEQWRHAHDQNMEWREFDPADNPKGKGMEFYDEEQAEYCNFLFNLDDPQYYAKFYKIFKPSPAKIEQMKKWLFEFSDGKLNEQYWRDLKDHKVDEHYWEKFD